PYNVSANHELALVLSATDRDEEACKLLVKVIGLLEQAVTQGRNRQDLSEASADLVKVRRKLESRTATANVSHITGNTDGILARSDDHGFYAWTLTLPNCRKK
ncbi:MAG: hypothetical protein KGI97_03130, partial [Alphaproteobacteria bacterium]|nr:hypothetical protein [Alphaproteobacteria bacterium]